MHIKKVRSNVKAGFDGEIGEKTLVVGRNGSGKSTIVNAVELALTGRAGDIAGRVDIAREADVMQLAPAGTTTLLAEALFDDGTAASYVAEGSTAKAKKAQVVRPPTVTHEDVLPIRTLREALLGSPVTARKFLLGKLGGAATREDVEALLPEPVRASWRAAVATVPSTVSPADTLIAVQEIAAKNQREANASAKTAREAAKLVSGGRSSPPTDAQIRIATEARDNSRRAHAAADRASSRLAELSLAKESVRIRTEQFKDADALAEKAKARLDALPPVKALPPIVTPMLAVMDASVEAGACLTCDGQPPTADLVQSVREAIAQNERDRAAITAAEKELTKLANEALTAHAKLEAANAALEKVESTGAYTGPSLEECEADLKKMDDALSALKSARDAWNTAQKAESTALDSERRSSEWEALKSAATDAIGITLDQALAAFVNKVQSNLPAGDVFDLRLRDGDREVVQFGLVREDKLHTALSGAEWARVMAAMANACVEEGRYACIIPEERAFDPDTLEGVLVALGNSPHQVIITSPVAPAAVPAGWTVIER
jgi:energy-coupling factor transporter ATP-binding protein EcfA2